MACQARRVEVMLNISVPLAAPVARLFVFGSIARSRPSSQASIACAFVTRFALVAALADVF